MSFDALLVDRIDILRLASGSDRYGNASRTYTTVAENVAARIEIDGSTEEDEVTSATTARGRIFTRHLDINAHDRLVSGEETWEVVGQPLVRRKSAQAHHIEATVERVEL